MHKKLVGIVSALAAVIALESAAFAQATSEGDILGDDQRTEVFDQLQNALEDKNLPSDWIDDLRNDPPDIHFTDNLGDNEAIYQPAWQGPFGNGLSGDTIHAKPGIDPLNLTDGEIATLIHESWHAWFDFVPTYPFSEVSRFSDGQDEAIGGFIEELVSGSGLQEAVSRALGEGRARGASDQDGVDAIKALENAWEGSFFTNGFKNQSDVNSWVILRVTTPEIEELEQFLSAEDRQRIQDRIAERERLREADPPLDEEEVDTTAAETSEGTTGTVGGAGTRTEPENEPEPDEEPEGNEDSEESEVGGYTPDNCPPCQPVSNQLAAAKKKLAEQQAAARGLQGDLQRVETDIAGARNRVNGLEGVLNRSGGTGGSSFDPGTGITIDAWDQGDGTVKITTRDKNGNVISERTRDASREKARVRRALDRERAKLEALEARKAKLEAQIEAQQAKIAATEAETQKLASELANCIERFCSGAATTDAVGTGGVLIDPATTPDLINGSGSAMSTAGRNPAVQLMILEFTPIELPPGGTPGPGDAAERMTGPTRFRHAFRPHLETSQTAPGPGGAGVRLVLESLGVSTGEAFTLRAFHEGGGLAALSGEGIVVEPIAKEARKSVQKELAKLAGKNEIVQKVDGYCLEFLRQPPEAGTYFRVASQELQERFAPIRNILTTSRQLFESGALSPDSDPAQYFHSIRQWAIWSSEEGFDLDGFGKAFVERTKKNFEAANHKWTGDVEKVVEGLVANRWADIQRILTEAERVP